MTAKIFSRVLCHTIFELEVSLEQLFVWCRQLLAKSGFADGHAENHSWEGLPHRVQGALRTRVGIGTNPRDKVYEPFLAVMPEDAGLIIAEADHLCEHVFDLLGSGPTPLGERIDWHVDFKSGHRWNPKTYYKRIWYAPYPGGYDIKVPWELSRCQHFPRLGQAYLLTGDEKYAREFVAQATDWIEQNPWPWGVNWASSMDVAIRAVNWLWAYRFFEGSQSLSPGFKACFFTSLLTQGRHIFRNLENKGGIRNNHYLTDLVGLVHLGVLCPGFKEVKR